MTREEIAEHRRRFYAGEPAVARGSLTITPPCPLTPGWLARAAQFIEVTTSPPVADSVFELRQAACRTCPHREEKKRVLFCGCCHCPKWRIAGLDIKNRFKAWECPIGSFGAERPETPAM